MVIGYSRQRERISDLNRVAEKLIFDLRRAQQLSLLMAPLKSLPLNKKICGWGLYFQDDFSYILFADLVSLDSFCPGNKELDAGEEQEKIKFVRGVKIKGKNTEIIFFSPPEPKTEFKPSVSEAKIDLEISPELPYIQIKVNKAGMITKEVVF